MNKREFIKKSALGLAASSALAIPIQASASTSQEENGLNFLGELSREFNQELEGSIIQEIKTSEYFLTDLYKRNNNIKRDIEKIIEKLCISNQAVRMVKYANSDPKWAEKVILSDERKKVAVSSAGIMYRMNYSSLEFAEGIAEKFNSSDLARKLWVETTLNKWCHKGDNVDIEWVKNMYERDDDANMADILWHLSADNPDDVKWAERFIENRKNYLYVLSAYRVLGADREWTKRMLLMSMDKDRNDKYIVAFKSSLRKEDKEWFNNGVEQELTRRATLL